jgi:hypothetical protein
MERDYGQFPDDENGEVLWKLHSDGDALTEPREIDFSAIFPSEDAAINFAVACLRSGFKVEMAQAEEDHEDGLNWEVVVYTFAVPTYEDITAIENALDKEAAELGGALSGWSSVFLSPE